jgi:hypothetical protein
MKTLIESSIEIYGMGHPDTKTVFNIKDETERSNMRFKSLTTISGRKLTVNYKYTENDAEVADKLQMVIVKSDDEQVVKDFILAEINNKLNS